MGVLKEPAAPTSASRRVKAVRSVGLSGGVVAALCLLGFLVIGLLFDIIPTFRSTTVERNQPPVLQRLERLNKFKAASGTFQVVIDLEKDVDGVPAALAGERTVMVASGNVDAEVDFTGLRGSAVQVSRDRKSVTVTVPAPTLTPARLDNEKTYVVSRSRGILDRIEDAISDQPVNDQDLYVNAEDELESAAKESELLKTARSNTEDMLTQMLEGLGFEDVNVVFADEATG